MQVRIEVKRLGAKASCVLTLVLVITPPAHAEEPRRAPAPGVGAESLEKTSEHPEARFPGAFAIPGVGGWLKVGGYAKGDVIYDFGPIGDATSFATATIPVPTSDEGSSITLTARQSRFNLDTRFDTKVGVVRAFLEADFDGSPGTVLRLRHAYGEWRGLLAGQTWTAFMDPAAIPDTLDFQGAEGLIRVRQAQVRYTWRPSEVVELGLSVEQPGAKIAAAPGATGVSRSQVPDVPLFVAFQPKWGHVRLATVVTQLRYAAADGSIDVATVGYGASISSVARVGPRDRLQLQFSAGSGVAHYTSGLSGDDSDGYASAAGLRASPAWSVSCAYTHAWTPTLRSTFVLSRVAVEPADEQPDTTLRRLISPHLNLIWQPDPHLTLGAEVMWGQRQNKNYEHADATRVMASAYFTL